MRVLPKNGQLLRLLRVVVCLGMCAGSTVALAQDSPTESERNPARIALERNHPESYVGGQTIEVTIRISASNWSGITAVGLYEKVPSGWTLLNARTVSGPGPAVGPENGDSGVLQFLWITPPKVPVEYQYTLQIPTRDHGARTLSGQVEYRQGAGKLTSNVALTRLDGVADELPVITLRGRANITLREGGSFTDPGATAKDKEDGDLSARIQTVGRVDVGKPGQYRIVYGVTDSVGNRAIPVTRTVTVTTAARDAADGGQGRSGAGGAGSANLRDPFAQTDGPPATVAPESRPGVLPPISTMPGAVLGGEGREFRPPLLEKAGEGDNTDEGRQSASRFAGRAPPGALPPGGQMSSERIGESGGDAAGYPPGERESGTGLLLTAALVIVPALLLAGWWTARGARHRRIRRR